MSLKEMLGSTGGIAAASAAIAAGGLGYFLFLSEPHESPTLAPVAETDKAQMEGQAKSEEQTEKSTTSTPPKDNASLEEISDAPPAPSANENARVAEEIEPETSSVENTSLGQDDSAIDSPAVELPRFSDMRLDAEGLAVIAGTAPADYEVQVREGKATLASALANASGDFAMIFDLPGTGTARVLYLVALDGTGREYRSEQSAILTPPVAPAPVPKEVQVAASEAIAPGQTPRLDGTTQSASTVPSFGSSSSETDRTALAMAPAIVELPEPETDTAVAIQDPGGPREQDAVVQPETTKTVEVAEQVAAQEVKPEAVEAQAEPLVAEDTRPVDGVETDERSTETVPTVLLAGREGVELLQPSNANLERLGEQVVVDVISYSDDGSVALSGRAATDLSRADQVQVYLNNRAVQTAQLARDGSWNMSMPPVEPGIYTLRVDQVDAAGKVLARFETPFKREDPSDLARMTPADLAQGGLEASLITVQPGYTLWGIATDRYGSGFDYVQIFEANRNQIRDPDLIYPGQVFELPEGSGGTVTK